MSDNRELNVRVAPFGPGAEVIAATSMAMLEHPAVQEFLRDTQHRLLAFELVDSPRKTSRPAPPVGYRGTVYDYTNNRTIFVDGRFDNQDLVHVSESGIQPLPSSEEFDAAVEMVMEQPEIGRALREQLVQAYRPMPPLVEMELPDGRIERTVTVGLLPRDDTVRHEIVGVNMIRREVVRFDGGAPEGALAHHTSCGVPNAAQSTASRNTGGQVSVTVTQGSTVLWRFLVVRPAASSGTNGSGVELRFVDYRGKRVLYRANVPILNVLYDSGCGPSYRDWQWQEGMLQTPAAPPAIDFAPGIRFCPTPAQTILDSGTDAGNFLGVAIYVAGQEVVLVSEMQAGWYRYISEWRLHADGTIRPRFGFSAVQSSCVCQTHHHHVYWRLDFDIRTAGNNIVREFNDPPLFASNWHTKSYEIRRLKDPARNRRWQVQNTMTGEAYTLIPGPNDGVADPAFGIGDMWALLYRGSSSPPSGELDDGQGFTTTPALARANIDMFRNFEYIQDRDVVIWYGAHFTHDVNLGPGEIVGPDLVASDW